MACPLQGNASSFRDIHSLQVSCASRSRTLEAATTHSSTPTSTGPKFPESWALKCALSTARHYIRSYVIRSYAWHRWTGFP